jgi:hypothetical protein
LNVSRFYRCSRSFCWASLYKAAHCASLKQKSRCQIYRISQRLSFLNSGSDGKFRLQGATPKTFLCGWAPENSSGHLGYQYMHNYNFASHCNLKFRIFKNRLVGYLVNPSRDEDKWEPAISIGISKHYYREKARDENGRDSNRVVEQERSDWEARPYMSLDFSNINILLDRFDAFACYSGGSTSVDGVVENETEWDHDNGFLRIHSESLQPLWPQGLHDQSLRNTPIQFYAI